MKNTLKNTFIFFLMSLGIIYIPLSCGNIEDLTKDVVLTVDNNLVRIPLAIRFFDVNPVSSSELVPELTIEVTGPDADKLYTTTLEKLKDLGSIKGGLVDVAVKSSQIITPDRPLNFTIRAYAKTGNFLPVIHNFRLTDTSKVVENIGVLNINHVPSGVDVETSSVTVGSDGAVEKSIIQAEMAQVEIPKGLKFKTRDGQEVTGNIEVRVIQFSPTKEASLEAFPGGLQPTKLKDIDGTPLEPGFFQSLGFISLDMQVGGKQVKTFESGQINVTYKLEKGLFNSETEKSLRLGDKVPLWSLDDQTGEWQKEANLTITGTPENLEAKWSQSHLSQWNLDYFVDLCYSGATVIFSNNVPIGGYQIDFIDKNKLNVFLSKRNYIKPGVPFELLNVPRRQLLIRLKSEAGYESYSQPVDLCSNNTYNLTNSFDLAKLKVNPLISVTAKGVCKSKPNININPTLTVWFTKSSEPTKFQELGTIQNGSLSTQALAPGEEYIFKTSINGESHTYTYKIPIQDNYNLVFDKIEIPEKYCALVK